MGKWLELGKTFIELADAIKKKSKNEKSLWFNGSTNEFIKLFNFIDIGNRSIICTDIIKGKCHVPQKQGIIICIQNGGKLKKYANYEQRVSIHSI